MNCHLVSRVDPPGLLTYFQVPGDRPTARGQPVPKANSEGGR
jgi:hypothetical protein